MLYSNDKIVNSLTRRSFLKKGVLITTTVLTPGIISQSVFAEQSSDTNENIQKMSENIYWIEQASVKIKTETTTIYIDPYKIKLNDEADIVFITHSHHDHFSLRDISKVATEKTVFIATDDCINRIRKKFPDNRVIGVKPKMNDTVNGVAFETIHSYNVKKTQYHPKKKMWVGYIINVDGVKIYHAGDTERIPEMKNYSCDIALIPLGQNYTMNSVEDAAKAVKDMKAKIAIPIHFGYNEGSVKDPEKLKIFLKNSAAVIVKKK